MSSENDSTPSIKLSSFQLSSMPKIDLPMNTYCRLLYRASLTGLIVVFSSGGASAADGERPEKKLTVPVFKDGEAQVGDGFKDPDY